MDSDLEFAALNRPRAAALRSLEASKGGRHHPELEARARRLDAQVAEIKESLLFVYTMSRLARNEAPKLHPGQGAGLGAILCAGEGEMIGRDYVQ